MKIKFSEQSEAELVKADRIDEVNQAVKSLGLAHSRPVLVLVGGAGGVSDEQKAIINHAITIVAEVVDRNQVAVVDGGTDSGVMAAIGQARKSGRYRFPLVGVAVENLVEWPGEPADRPPGKDRFPLEAHHSHFVLVPGENWGDESKSLAEVGTAIAGKYHSATILLNGGEIAKEDVAHSLEAGRPVIVLQGTGRYADELADHPPGTHMIKIVPASNDEKVASTLQAILS